MGFIPEDVIRQVLDRSDIAEIIASYVPLKQAGRNFKALCPFHHEKTPSFMVNPAKQIYHCFGCGVGGNVISFVMAQEHLDFPEAVRFLAAKAGVDIPVAQERESQASQLRQELRRVNDLAAEYFHHNLLSDKSSSVAAARKYLQGRKISLEMVKNFQLGFALDCWDGLLEYLRKKGVSLRLMEKAGLVIAQQRKEGYYDRFRNRIIFPIFDVQGKCMAFGARAMEDDNPAKYINSPETTLYTKGDHLYGFHLSKESVTRQDSAVVVEGYLDFIMPFQMGVQNIVASLGTALTEQQIRTLRRYTKNVIMLFDSDQAGLSAMVRSLDVLIEEGMNVKVATLFQDEDPDSFIRQHGVTKFQERISAAESLFDFKLKILIQRYGTGSVESRAQISAEMLTTIDKFKNAIVKSEYLKKLAMRLALSQEALLTELKKISSPETRTDFRKQQRTNTGIAEPLRPVERDLLGLMLTEADFVPLVKNDVGLADFQNSAVRSIVTKIYELFEKGREVSPANVMSSFNDQKILQLISGLLAKEDLLIGDKKRIFQDCIARLRQERLRHQRREILQKMELARHERNEQALEKLTQEFNLLIKG